MGEHGGPQYADRPPELRTEVEDRIEMYGYWNAVTSGKPVEARCQTERLTTFSLARDRALDRAISLAGK